MSEFDKQLAIMYQAIKREEIRCFCIVLCVIIVMASVIGMTLYCMSPPLCAAQPTTYTYTTDSGQTVTTTITGNSTTTIVTDSTGRVISTSITGGRRASTYTRQNTERQEQRARARAERREQREARRREREAARLERQAARLERQAERLRERANK